MESFPEEKQEQLLSQQVGPPELEEYRKKSQSQSTNGALGESLPLSHFSPSKQKQNNP